jgi:hypothetical protein
MFLNNNIFWFCNKSSPSSILDATGVFLTPENVCLDTKIVSLSHFAAEILVKIGFYTMAALKVQDGRHNQPGGSGTPSKFKARVMSSTRKKFGAFVRNVHIILKSGPKLPD